MMGRDTTRVGIDEMGLRDWNLRREEEMGNSMESENVESHTGKGERVDKGFTQEE